MTTYFEIICHLIYIYLILFIISPFVISAFRKYSLIDSARYTDKIRQDLYTTRIQCMINCENLDECKSVNHNDDLETCELTSRLPSLVQPSVTSEPSWKVYYSEYRVRAIDEWQSSTYNFEGQLLVAAYATDRKRKNIGLECARTSEGFSYGFSYWAMEFERVENVSHILVYFKNNFDKNHRNAELRFMISSTRNDSDYNKGTDCAYYNGPPTSPAPPTLIACTDLVTGKFLKIIHYIDQPLVLCEVEVYFV